MVFLCKDFVTTKFFFITASHLLSIIIENWNEMRMNLHFIQISILNCELFLRNYVTPVKDAILVQCGTHWGDSTARCEF